MEIFGILALSFSFLLLIANLFSIVLVLPRLRHKRTLKPILNNAPRITLLRPIKGLEVDLETTLASSLTLDYPNYQTLFCVEDANDPAAKLVNRLIKEHPNADAKLLIGHNLISQNPKINNLIKGWQVADGKFVAIADSNIILSPDYLSQLLTRWDSKTGLVSSPAIGINPNGLGGALECAFLNGYQARWQLVADQLGMGYAQGKTLFWNRRFLVDAGGPEILGAEIAEDAASTRLVRGAGLKVRLTRQPFAHPIGKREIAAVWQRQLRWAIIRRIEFPWLFFSEILSGACLPILTFAFGLYGLNLPISITFAYAAFWYGGEWALTRTAGWPSTPLVFASSFLRDIMLPILWLIAWSRKSFKWQGNYLNSKDEPTIHNKATKP